MNIKIQPYPYNNDCALAITIDDLHPEGKNDKEHLDFGYDIHGDFWNEIEKLQHIYPQIKITLFTVANWIDRSDWPAGIFWPLRALFRRRREYAPDTFNISDKKYRNWVADINKKVSNSTIEIGLHGLMHHNEQLACGASTEFAHITPKETKEKISAMLQIFKTSKLKYSIGFRSPGWATSAVLLTELEKQGIIYTANSADFTSSINTNASMQTGMKKQHLYTPNFINDALVNFTANCFAYQYQRAVEIAKKKGIIIIHGHVAKTVFGLQYVDKHFVQHVRKIINEIRNQTLHHIWYATLSEMAAFFLAKQKLSYKVQKDGTIQFLNNSHFDLHGLTVTVDNQNYVIDRISATKAYVFDKKKIKQEKVKVSAILTVYNGEKNVIESLESLTNQSYRNLEIIVVNDGSKDATKDVLSQYKKQHRDERITIINQNNLGRAKARNNGFKKSTGDIVTFCEDDAKYDKDYVKNAVAIFEKDRKKLGGIIGPHYVWNKNESINTRAKDVERRRNFTNYKPQSCWFYRREDFIKAGMFDEQLELVDDVVPAFVLKKKGYHFVYADDCRWLHKEPPDFFKYLRRKWRGGVGMALLQKSGWKRSIVPKQYWLILFVLIGIAALTLIIKPVLVLLFIPLAIIGLLLLRIKDIQKVYPVTNESIGFLIFEIYIEYLWWFSTFLGYLYGLTMTSEAINTYLKGR